MDLLNKIHNENCLATMKRMPDNFIDLTVTSPPYDNLRLYKGYSFEFEKVAKSLLRVTKDGGTVVWVVADATIKGDRTGTSFKQALYFKEIGFNLYDNIIWVKHTCMVPPPGRYAAAYEYMFVFTKGNIKTVNLICDRETKNKNDAVRHKAIVVQRRSLKTQEYTTKFRKMRSQRYAARFNVWQIASNSVSTDHPAMFPEQLANDHILSWSNPGDIVYDPFTGSGTTPKMALVNNRRFIGSEISEGYWNIANKRIRGVRGDMDKFI